MEVLEVLHQHVLFETNIETADMLNADIADTRLRGGGRLGFDLLKPTSLHSSSPHIVPRNDR